MSVLRYRLDDITDYHLHFNIQRAGEHFTIAPAEDL
jgi:hypothetical protein